MKEELFNQYTQKVMSTFGLSKEELFRKTKKRHIVDARQMLWYVCNRRPMRVIQIREYMSNNGYSTAHSVILHGINVMSEKIEDDQDYADIYSTLCT